MEHDKLHQGVLVRQVLSGKRKVRISFIPDDTDKKPETSIRKYDDGEKNSWAKLLGNAPAVDIDKGILLVRFNKGNMSGQAVFLPAKAKDAVIANLFHDSLGGGGGTPAGLVEFNNCVEAKKTNAANLNIPFDGLKAVSECINQL